MLTCYSGVARSFLRTSTFTRPTAGRRAFQPIKNNLAPALGARFASGVGDGKIHQVIGAVVDGTQIPQQLNDVFSWNHRHGASGY